MTESRIMQETDGHIVRHLHQVCRGKKRFELKGYVVNLLNDIILVLIIRDNEKILKGVFF